jgi:hypothetical protein
LNKEDINELLRTNHLLSDLYKRIDFYNNHIRNMMIKKTQLEQEIKAKKREDINLRKHVVFSQDV